ncbi:MAG: T9SS type A sorting domain-containing protein [Bacteroidales bacterium]|nr:T9SS type A sorting domain-containing protein [Bacteroidales bacterium]
MKPHLLLLITLLSITGFLSAQVMFVVDSLPDYTPPDDILYIAGDFQGWDPGDPAYALQKNAEDKWFIQLDSMASGTTLQFKFTRGDWGRVEKGEFGEEIPNREFTYGNGETVHVIIYNWADGGGGNSTAAENVIVMDEEFFMPQLERNRRIWLYLPPDYNANEDNYPVIYMHDGQNLFDTYTAFAGEWEVDETLNDLFDLGYKVPIVVGIDNGGTERINEYTPWVNPGYGGGQGALYIDFIVETLKPYIDENYRTAPGRESTAIWGSSLGGLISHYGAMKFQNVFSKAGIYSPSYWFSDSVWTFTNDMGHQQAMRLYQMTGSLEGGSMVANTWAMQDTLAELGFGSEEITTKIVEGGQHNEQLWREDFAEAYLWLFQSYADDIHENIALDNIIFSPNPIQNTLVLPAGIVNQSGKIKIYDMLGNLVMSKDLVHAQSFDVSALETGMYIIKIQTKAGLFRGKIQKD